MQDEGPWPFGTGVPAPPVADSDGFGCPGCAASRGVGVPYPDFGDSVPPEGDDDPTWDLGFLPEAGCDEDPAWDGFVGFEPFPAGAYGPDDGGCCGGGGGTPLPTTTKGDLVVHDGTTNVRLPVGSDGQVLTADAAQSTGVKWATPSAGGYDPVTDPFLLVMAGP